MIIQHIQIKNFRSIQNASFTCDSLTALVGRNGTGKSSFLSALELFYDQSAKVQADDFYAGDTSLEIEVVLTFSDLTEEEEKFFTAYIDNGMLSVARIFSNGSGTNSGSYHGMRLQNPDFAEIRAADGRRDFTNKYNELKSKGKYTSLPTVRSADQADQALTEWENAHPKERIRIRDDGQFFGFTGVGQGYLGRYTRFIRVPAVRDATDDATDKRGSSISEIMDLVVRSVVSTRKDVTALKEQTQTQYEAILDPSKLTELTTLEVQLSQTLKQYAPDASVSLSWSDLAEITIPMPEAEIKLSEDGYKSAVQQTGHGLQRAFILTMLQHLVAAREMERASTGDLDSNNSKDTEVTSVPNLVLAVEEPELYQHPSRQRHMASVLLQLAQGSVPGVAKQTQVIYATHAPLFVGLDRFDQIRIIRKAEGNLGDPKTTSVTTVSLNSVAEKLWGLDGQTGERYTPSTLRPRMQAVMTPWMNEGFFADVVVLVEGVGDHAAVLAVARSMGINLESFNICVIPCLGKNNLDKPAVVFLEFGISTYVIWDSDSSSMNPISDDNKRLLRLVGATENDSQFGVFNSYTCLNNNLECTLRSEISEPVFDELLALFCDEFGMRRNQAIKNPYVLNKIILAAKDRGHTSETLCEVVQRIVDLHHAYAQGDRASFGFNRMEKAGSL